MVFQIRLAPFKLVKNMAARMVCRRKKCYSKAIVPVLAKFNLLILTKVLAKFNLLILTKLLTQFFSSFEDSNNGILYGLPDKTGTF
jgi:hypothetical protein